MILGMTFSVIKYSHSVVQQSPLSISRIFSSLQTETILIKQSLFPSLVTSVLLSVYMNLASLSTL